LNIQLTTLILLEYPNHLTLRIQEKILQPFISQVYMPNQLELLSKVFMGGLLLEFNSFIMI